MFTWFRGFSGKFESKLEHKARQAAQSGHRLAEALDADRFSVQLGVPGLAFTFEFDRRKKD